VTTEALPLLPCDCSVKHPWVVACIHGDGNFVVTLRDYQHPAYLDLYWDDEEENRYEAMGGYDHGPFVYGYRGDDLDAALASLFAIKDGEIAHRRERTTCPGLRRNGLVTERGGRIVATDVLFP
jgi:hypothetical protein